MSGIDSSIVGTILGLVIGTSKVGKLVSWLSSVIPTIGSTGSTGASTLALLVNFLITGGFSLDLSLIRIWPSRRYSERLFGLNPLEFCLDFILLKSMLNMPL